VWNAPGRIRRAPGRQGSDRERCAGPAVVSMGIVGYLWLRFEWKFGLSAIIANLHDVVIILGFFAFSSGNSRCLCWRRCWRYWAIR